MKNLSIIIVAACVLTFSSCGEPDAYGCNVPQFSFSAPVQQFSVPVQQFHVPQQVILQQRIRQRFVQPQHFVAPQQVILQQRVRPRRGFSLNFGF